MRNSIGKKAGLAVLAAGVVPLLVAVIWIAFQGNASLKKSIGANFQGLAEETARKVTYLVDNEIRKAQHISHDMEVIRTLREIDRTFQGVGETGVRERLSALESRWKSYQRSPKAQTPLRNSAQTFLENFQKLEPAGKYRTLFITDTRGAVVASINAYPDFLHAGKDWWRKTYEGGEGNIWLRSPDRDPVNGRTFQDMAFPITDPDSRQVIGILKIMYDLDLFLKPAIFETRIGKTGHAMIVDSAGDVISCPILPTGFHIADQGLTRRITDYRPGWFTAANDAHGGTRSLVGHAPVAEFKGLSPLGWFIFIRQDPSETYAPITNLLYTVAASGTLAVLLLTFLGFSASRTLTRPIKQLHAGVGHFGRGDLDYRLKIQTGDEIEGLAEAFNNMAGQLKESYENLEQKVADRTRELAALYAVAATVNRSLDQEEVLYGALDKIMETLKVNAGAIRLLDEERGRVILRASRGIPGDPLQGEKEMPLGEGIAGTVAQTGEPILIENLDTQPRGISLLIRNGFKSVMCVPIRCKERIIGTLSVASEQPGSFTSSDLLLLSAIGDQVGTGVENAALYRKEQEMVARLQEIDRFKSEFLSNVSHELRTPLTSIIGFAELLMERTAGLPDKTYPEYLQNMLTSSEHLLQMINNLLDLSKIEAGKMEVYLGEFCIKGLVEGAAKTVHPLARKKNLRIVTQLPEILPTMIADEGKVKQILLNLLSNAIKFTPEGGEIAVSAAFKQASGLTDGEGHFDVSVSDTGIGVKPEHLKIIFETFHQVDSTYTRHYSGTGIGLALCKRFVQMQGGNIWAESEFGRWTRITFSLPRKPAHAVAAESAGPAEGLSPLALAASGDPREGIAPLPLRETMIAVDGVGLTESGEKPVILVVEDDPQVSQLLNQFLVTAGYEVVHAYRGEEVLEKARTARPFAVTLDIMLPGKDGWEVLQELKQHPETQNIPVIIVSIISNRDLGFSLGASDYLTKPIDRNVLLEAIRKQSLTSKRKRKPVTILVVDDEPPIVELISRTLEENGFGVVKAYNGRKGIDLAIEMQPDLIVLDLMMPDISGFEVINQLKNHPTARNIPVVICTAKNLTPEEKNHLTEQTRHIVFKGGSIKDQLLREVQKLERLYPDKARMVDGLTGLPNHKYFQNRLSDEIEKAKRYRKTFSLLTANIDGFTAFNDRWGVSEGDRALRETAEILRLNIRSANSVARYGGSTFNLILPNTTKQAAAAMGERLRKIVESHSLPDGNGGKRLTISIGIATYFEDTETGVGLIRAAEAALEQGKRNGGNQVVAHGGTSD